MIKIAIFYGSTTCYTEIVAEKIQALLQAYLAASEQFPAGTSVTLMNIKQQPLVKMHDYDWLILGISTWDFGELQEDWEAQWSDISEVDLRDKIVAIYGMGDQIGYSDWFVDAMGMLDVAIAEHGCQRIGFWSTQGYEFTRSKAVSADPEWFVGLALDEENQYDLTDERLATWVEQLLDEVVAIRG